MQPLKGYLTSAAAAAHLGITRQTFDNQAQSADFPEPRRIGRTPLWKITDLDAWRVRHPARRKHSRPGGDQQSSAPK